jgi:3-hydroxybutyryl-CoA dehydrogenase
MTDVTTEEPTGRTFETIGIVGLGTMGAGIAEVFAREGYQVVGVEQNDESLARGRQHLENSTARAVARQKMTEEEQAELLGRISFSTELKALTDADFVVEAVVESVEVKKQIFRELDSIVAPKTILATNTSSLSVTDISTANSQPGRVIGVHFFNPAPVQGLVEIVRTVVTEEQVLADVSALVRQVGKNPVVCGDKAGFIANTLLFGYLNHAVAMYEGKYASREDIDAVRLRVPHGSARAARPHRPRHGVRDPGDDVPAGPRPAARAVADPQADGHRRDARPQDRARVLHLRGAGQPQDRC